MQGSETGPRRVQRSVAQRHNMTHIYPWEAVYRQAIEETDPAKLPDQLAAAQQAVYDRVNTIRFRKDALIVPDVTVHAEIYRPLGEVNHGDAD